MSLISVIVPIYNSAAYIDQCLSSILMQSVTNMELILVDDGSTDQSGAICDDYASKDERVKVIHQTNAGVSVARNAGIAAATGEYIGFVDSDDTVAEDMFEQMLSKAKETLADIVLCDAQAMKENGQIAEIETIETLPESCLLHKGDITPPVLLEIAGAVWRCIYRADLIKTNDIGFPQGLKISEDRIFNINAMGRARCVAYVKVPLYHRLLHSGSTVHRYHSDYLQIVEKGREATEQALDIAWNGAPEYKNAYLNQYVYAVLVAIEQLKRPEAKLSYQARKRIVRGLCRNSRIQEAIKITGYADKNIYAAWIAQRKVFLLSTTSRRICKGYARIQKAVEWRIRRIRRKKS